MATTQGEAHNEDVPGSDTAGATADGVLSAADLGSVPRGVLSSNETAYGADVMSNLSREAAHTLIGALWPEGEWAQHLTCIEANTVAEWIGSELGEEQRRDLIQAHSLSDDDEADAHYAIGKVTQQRGIGWVCKHRPDDSPEPGDRCKDCGLPITWVGPSQNDWRLA